MPKIVLSYRREDTRSDAGRLYDDLVDQFGEDEVFRDIDTIPPGVDFVDALEKAIGSSNVVLALIGKRWFTATARRKLSDPKITLGLSLPQRLIATFVSYQCWSRERVYRKPVFCQIR